MIERIECKISSERSTGYDYLLWIARTAKNLKLTGKIFNNDDGSIGLVAEGDDEVLSIFSKKITEMRPITLSLLDNFFMKWHKATGEFTDFFIIDKKNKY